MRRGHRYERAIERLRPLQPHHFLSVIGVRPELQRGGYGRLPMGEIHERADRDPRSGGLCLDTGDADNRVWYERQGYEVVAETRTGPLRQWSLFRPAAGPPVGRVIGPSFDVRQRRALRAHRTRGRICAPADVSGR